MRELWITTLVIFVCLECIESLEIFDAGNKFDWDLLKRGIVIDAVLSLVIGFILVTILKLVLLIPGLAA